MIRALFLDIDGTLVSFKTHAIPQSTIEALTAIHEKGIRIFISTGRPQVIMNNIGELQERGLIDGYITMNGGYCYVGDQVLYKRSIPHGAVRIVADACKKYNTSCIFFGEHDAYVSQPNELLRGIFYDFLKVNEFAILPFEEAIDREIFQMTPFFNIEMEKSVVSQLPHCEWGRWHPDFLDVTAEGNTKQQGIDQIIRHFNFKLEETMSFGDGGNDIGMLRHAGIGIAMGNAEEQVKMAADYVTTSVDEDGIATALKHFRLI